MDTKEKQNLLYNAYLKYRNGVYHMAYESAHDQDAAEDIVYRVYSSLAESNILEDCCNDENRIKLYLMILINQETCNHINRKQPCTEKKSVLNQTDVRKDYNLLSQMSLDEIVGCIRKIPKSYADLMILKYAEQNDDNSIARLLRMKEKKVKEVIEDSKKMIMETCLNSRQEKD